MKISNGKITFLNIWNVKGEEKVKISMVQSNMHNSLIVNNHQSEEEISSPNFSKLNRQEDQNYDVTVRNKEDYNLSIGEEKFIKMIDNSKTILLEPHTEVQLSVHEKTKRISIKIINTENQEVIKEIRSEKSLDMLAKLWELSGLFADEKA